MSRAAQQKGLQELGIQGNTGQECGHFPHLEALPSIWIIMHSRCLISAASSQPLPPAASSHLGLSFLGGEDIPEQLQSPLEAAPEGISGSWLSAGPHGAGVSSCLLLASNAGRARMLKGWWGCSPRAGQGGSRGAGDTLDKMG